MFRKAFITVIALIILFTPGCGAKKTADGGNAENNQSGKGKAPKEVFKIFIKAIEDGSYAVAWDCLSMETKMRYVEDKGKTPDFVAGSKRFEDIMKKRMSDEGERIEITSAVVTEEKINNKEAVLKITYTKIKKKQDVEKDGDPAVTKTTALGFVLTGDGWKIHAPAGGKASQDGKNQAVAEKKQ